MNEMPKSITPEENVATRMYLAAASALSFLFLSKATIQARGTEAISRPRKNMRNEPEDIIMYIPRSVESISIKNSPAYFMFEIKDESKLDPEYLMMWFRRPEFDRICWLRTDGSVRGGITWEDLCRIELPVPTMDEQKAVVNSYKAITDRIALKRQINDNLVA